MRRSAATVVLLGVVWATVPLVASARPADGVSALSVYGGLGSWLDIFASATWSRAPAVVAAAKANGVRTLYLQTSNYSQSSDVVRPAALGRFIDAAHAAGLMVTAWYLPGFDSPARDARRALAAIHFRSATGQRFDSFALDIEASVISSVTRRNERLLTLARLLRRAVPATYPLGAIIPSPVGMHRHPHYWPRFPYASLAKSFDAFLPMAYFSDYAHTAAAAYTYTHDVMVQIRAQTGPAEVIHVIGGSASAIPSATLAGFVRAVSDCAAQGISLYAFPETHPQDWTRLRAANLGGTPTAACRP